MTRLAGQARLVPGRGLREDIRAPLEFSAELGGLPLTVARPSGPRNEVLPVDARFPRAEVAAAGARLAGRTAVPAIGSGAA